MFDQISHLAVSPGSRQGKSGPAPQVARGPAEVADYVIPVAGSFERFATAELHSRAGVAIRA
jgi:hypothetical protein